VELGVQLGAQDASDRLHRLEKELQALKSDFASHSSKTNNKKEDEDEETVTKTFDNNILVLQDNIFNGFLLLYYNDTRWRSLQRWNQFRVCLWLILTMLLQLCCVSLLCGLLIHKGYHNIELLKTDISNVVLEVLAFLVPAVLAAGFIFVYDEVRRPLIEMADYHSHSALTIVGWWNLFGFVKTWEILFGLLGSWAYFISLIYSTKNTLQEAQGFIDIILNMLAYVFVFQIDEWAYSMIAIRELIPQWSDDWFQLKATENSQSFFKLVRKWIKLSMFAVYVVVLVLWFQEFYNSK